MFRIRRVFEDLTPADRSEVAEVKALLRERFPGYSEEYIEGLGERLHNPMDTRFRTILFVAQRKPGHVSAFAILMHAPAENFCFLDAIAASTAVTNQGVGGALYQRVREAARALGTLGLLYEVLPDAPERCPSEPERRANARRIAFYERFGARILTGSDYEVPVEAGETGWPYLMYDDLDTGRPLARDSARRVVRAILERRYPRLCPQDYVERVVASFRDDPVRTRAPQRAARAGGPAPVLPIRRVEQTIALFVSRHHGIHHVRDRGYVEAPARIDAILAALDVGGSFERLEPRHYGERYVRAVHDRPFCDYLRRLCRSLPEGKSAYPYVFPIRNAQRPPKQLDARVGYHCIDTFTPLNGAAYVAARGAVDCALSAANAILTGHRLAYALVRPPGHHAERRVFGGFCYFNSAAVAAEFLSRHGKIAMLDLDYHHGNGQQDIFYERSDVLTVSLHGHPSFAYPYFSGFEDERGSGPGHGFNRNFPLPEHTDGKRYRGALAKALRLVARFQPQFLVVPLGLDPARRDPTGTWALVAADFRENGRMVGGLGLPVVVVQEGGYHTKTLGSNTRAFFAGLLTGMAEAVR